MLYIFGPGGEGKTLLLREFAWHCAQRHVPAYFIDARAIEPTPDAFLAALQQTIGLEPAHAARLWGAAEALRVAIGAPLPPAERARLERLAAKVRAVIVTGSGRAFCAGGDLRFALAANPARSGDSFLALTTPAGARATLSGRPEDFANPESWVFSK